MLQLGQFKRVFNLWGGGIGTLAHHLLAGRLQGVGRGPVSLVPLIHLDLHLRLHACAHPAQCI